MIFDFGVWSITRCRDGYRSSHRRCSVKKVALKNFGTAASVNSSFASSTPSSMLGFFERGEGVEGGGALSHCFLFFLAIKTSS